MLWINIEFAMKVLKDQPYRFIKGIDRKFLFLLFNIPIKRPINTSVLDIKGKQRGIIGGFEGVGRGNPLETPYEPPINPL